MLKLIEKKSISFGLREEATSNIEVRNDIKGRFLTPEEGCGQSNVMTSNRIVGGGPAKNGEHAQIVWYLISILADSVKLTFHESLI